MGKKFFNNSNNECVKRKIARPPVVVLNTKCDGTRHKLVCYTKKLVGDT